MVDHFLYSHNLNWLIVSFFQKVTLADWLPCWLADYWSCWLTDWQAKLLITNFQNDWLSVWLTKRLTDWLTVWANKQTTDRRIDICFSDWLTDQLIEYHFPSHKGHLQQVNTHKQLLKRQFSLSKILPFILTPVAILGFPRTPGAEWKIYCHTCKHCADQKLSRKTLEPMPRNREPAMHCRTIDSFDTWRKQIDDTAKNNSLH